MYIVYIPADTYGMGSCKTVYIKAIGTFMFL